MYYIKGRHVHSPHNLLFHGSTNGQKSINYRHNLMNINNVVTQKTPDFLDVWKPISGMTHSERLHPQNSLLNTHLHPVMCHFSCGSH